jgi:regulatory protein
MTARRDQSPRKRATKLLDADGLWSYALKALGSRAFSTSEMRSRLRQKAQHPETIDQIIAKLRDYGYLNDAKFAESFATARRDNQGFGKMRVMRDLRQRRVAPAVAETAVSEAFEGTDEGEMVEQFLARKYRNVNLAAFLQDEKNLASAFRRLQYAGFGTASSIRVLKRYARRADEFEPEPSEEEPDRPE